ncbi:MAG: hypothetical protein GEU90_00630 [Gemmatimonas sp.]|nr:hypothetical protein [Gemmatimonas sp.]
MRPRVGDQHLVQLLTGNDHFDDAFGRGDNFDEQWAREVWAERREELIRYWRRGGSVPLAEVAAKPWHDYVAWIEGSADTMPWAWWRFDAPEPRPPHESERVYLRRHGLLDG